jgi:hypothetical protein
MVSKITLFLMFATVLTIFSCSSSKEFPSDYRGEQIHFGQGGGFTGGLNYFALLDDGRVFKRDSRDSSYAYIDRWDKAFVNQMMHSYHLLQLDSLQYYEPGDLYYFIQHQSRKTPVHRITWGRNGFKPDPKLTNYYHLLYTSTKPKS